MTEAAVGPVTAVRGRVLTFPPGPAEAVAHRYIADGLVVMQDGVFRAAGEASALLAALPSGVVVDHRPDCLILPGFIDAHIHYPQTRVIGSYGAQLLEWLHNYTFVEEQKFADPDHCGRGWRGSFSTSCSASGTTTAMVYCTVHPESVDAFFAEAERRGARMIAGKVHDGPQRARTALTRHRRARLRARARR